MRRKQAKLIFVAIFSLPIIENQWNSINGIKHKAVVWWVRPTGWAVNSMKGREIMRLVLVDCIGKGRTCAIFCVRLTFSPVFQRRVVVATSTTTTTTHECGKNARQPFNSLPLIACSIKLNVCGRSDGGVLFPFCHIIYGSNPPIDLWFYVRHHPYFLINGCPVLHVVM